MDRETFFNKVVLMRANQKQVEQLLAKKDLTNEDAIYLCKYINNKREFEEVIDKEIERINELRKQGKI